MTTQTLDQAYRAGLKTLTGSDHAWINTVFRWCVVQLIDLAALLGISYEALNIVVFILVLPTLLALSLAANATLWYWYRKCKAAKRPKLDTSATTGRQSSDYNT